MSNKSMSMSIISNSGTTEILQWFNYWFCIKI